MLMGSKALLKNAAKYVLTYHHRALTPTEQRHDDLYLVSYPKSGVTWLSFLMANIHLKMGGITREVNFYNINDFVPDIHSSRTLSGDIRFFPWHRTIKSHSAFNPFYQKVIYLVRDPRDVMVSYYFFLKGLGDFDGSLSELIHSRLLGITAWCKHVQSWIESTPVSVNIDFIRYEDLKADTRNVLNRVYQHLGYKIPDDILAESIEVASFENMKKLEKFYDFGGDMRFPDLEFVRKGQSAGYKLDLSEEDINYINKTAMRWMSIFKYTGV
jgi:hypothetical protein